MLDDLIFPPSVVAEIESLRHIICANPPGPSTNTLLWGRPGTGKTALLDAFAFSIASCGRNTLHFSAADFKSGFYIGQIANKARSVFERIAAAAPVFVSIDFEQGPYSDDSLFPSPESLLPGQSLDGFQQELRQQFLMELDRLQFKKIPVWIVGEIFDPNRLDPSVRHRFHRAIELPAPDEACRCEILKRKISAAVPNAAFDIGSLSSELAGRTVGQSGRDLESMVRSACNSAAKRGSSSESDAGTAGREDFLLAASRLT